ncbi:MAG: gliding motility-associated C-terminal domain-containing protein [Saprospiraceae bacterium]|nr:gliding motility-associated C-terminal domain-containing protein [Saprospiraceae bacterium]
MKRGLLLFFFGLICLPLMAQEICDNGSDDDGDGLVDIYDPDCICEGIVTIGPLEDVVPNPDFEEFLCCPSSFSQMNCVDGWQQGTSATTDYMNTCDFVMPAVEAAGLVPFPSGEGCVGAIFSNSWMELLASCLLQPLESGNQYTLSFQIASVPLTNFGDPCNNGVPFYDPVNITLYGNASCNIPVGTTGCPSGADPGWIILGTVLYTPLAAWDQISITFTPPTDINGIMIGPPCSLPAGYSGSPCYAYFLFDDIELQGGYNIFELDIFDIGLPCDLDYLLFAEVDHEGPGTWQWYFNGAAIPGQNDFEFQIANNNYLSGMYAVTYSTPDGCVMDSIYVNVPPKDTVTEQVYFCPGSQVDCAGETFFNPGVYEVHLTTDIGCDSVVECIVTEFVLPPITYLSIDTCGPVEIEVCGELFYETGQYQINCYDWRGCDSVIILDLRVMNPMAVILPPGLLDCGPNSDVVLDGASSSYNNLPGGNTYYEWTGPINGIDGATDEPFAFVTKTGKYCLTITHESNGVTCIDSACVTVQSSAAVPFTPILNGDPDACLGDTIILTPSPGGGAPLTGYTWDFDLSLNAIVVNDLYVQYVPSGPGSASFCVLAYNECGESDTTCFVVNTHIGDTILIDALTCDPAQAGISTQLLMNQFGCDSLVITDRTLVPQIVVNLNSTTCDPLMAGVDTVIYQTSFGCDSLVISTTALLPSSQSITYLTTCIPAQVGTDSVWLQNQYGCDSLAITTTDLLPSHLINQTFYTCDPAQAGLDTLWLTNQYGCDSTLYIERIFSGNYQETNIARICGAGTNYVDTLTITSGPCDSLFITNYIHIPLDTTWLSFTTCDPAMAGVNVTVLPAFTGCDSTIIAQTALLPSDVTNVNGVTCILAEERYETLTLQNQFGCDSIVNIAIQYVGVDTQFVQKTTCDQLMAGTVVDILTGQFCDTVRVTTTDYLPSSQSLEMIRVCAATGPARDTLVLQNSLGCDSLRIREYEYIDLSTELEVISERCAGDDDGEIRIVSLVGGDLPYEYRLGNGAWQTVDTFENLSPGTYSVTVRDANGCTETLAGLIVVEGLVLTLDAGYDQIAFRGDIVNLAVQSNFDLEFLQWSAPDPMSCPTCLVTTLGPLTQSQLVTVTGQTVDGCDASDDVYIDMKIRVEVYIPNSFTPNNDGINDVFSVYGNDQVVNVRNLAIYDRWGNALYSHSDLPINDPSKGWDGFFRDELMDPGVYVYVVEVELLDGDVRLFKGDVTLTR